jgi:DNA-directed RNA polymerase specialized sigma24 family protein
MSVRLPAFQRLVDAHWRDVARLAHALAGPADGDDVAQQAWAQALAAYPRLASAANLRGWLLSITANCAHDALRSRSRRPVPVPDPGEAVLAAPSRAVHSAVPPPGPPPGGDPLWVAVRSLPERQRTAVALRYVADLDHAEIARVLQISPANSRRLVSDALGELRRCLKGETFDDD